MSKAIKLTGLIIALFLVTSIQVIKAGDINAYAVIENNVVTNMIKLDSALVTQWEIDNNVVLIKFIGQDSLVVGSAYDSKEPIGSRFTKPIKDPKRVRISELENKIRSNTDTYAEFREYIIFRLNIE